MCTREVYARTKCTTILFNVFSHLREIFHGLVTCPYNITLYIISRCKPLRRHMPVMYSIGLSCTSAYLYRAQSRKHNLRGGGLERKGLRSTLRLKRKVQLLGTKNNNNFIIPFKIVKKKNIVFKIY